MLTFFARWTVDVVTELREWITAAREGGANSHTSPGKAQGAEGPGGTGGQGWGRAENEDLVQILYKGVLDQQVSSHIQGSLYPGQRRWVYSGKTVNQMGSRPRDISNGRRQGEALHWKQRP